MGEEYILDLTREQIISMMEQIARTRRGVSAKELLDLYRAGKLEDAGEVADFIALSDLLPEDDEIKAA